MTSILDHRSSEAYVVFVLMEVFEELLGRRYGQATLENQVAFIDKKKASLFGDPKWYAGAYTAAVSSY
ncbi:hypothetical protein [Luteimonas terrae]|uniref:Uncharacterized protein n=1 Tax=Luteimonas terrae TaxID=1530191 RepID=A0A4R5UA27_9GAMM|nr:hypothetical protein [Luteimonas terrae]TDK31559.1 hypothetical protein E2F49_08920 [Luteimonas terrae]